MHITWKQRLDYSPELFDFAKWPDIHTDTIPKKKRAVFLINCRIVAAVLDQKSFEEVGATVGVSKSKISKLMSRCLGGEEEEAPPLRYALIPGTHTIASIRRSPLSTFKNTTGAAGSFKQLLNDLPKLREHLELILDAHIKNRAHGQNIKPTFLFEAYKQFLEQVGWPKDRYPYTEESLGYESLRKYMHLTLEQKMLSKHVKEIHVSLNRPSVTQLTFTTIQLDEHTYDLNCAMSLSLSENLSPFRVSRVSLIVAVDVGTQTVLSYVVVLNRASNQQDVLDCLAGIYKKWKQKSFVTPGLEYGPKDGFPSGNIFDETSSPAIGELQLDNALVHIANRVRHYVTSVVGSTYNLGLPASPKTRNWVEYAFKILTNDAHRFKSTTGSNPTDPSKESRSNAKLPPPISVKALEETIEVLLAHHNSRRRANLGGSSPLEAMQHQLDHVFVPRLTADQCGAISSPAYALTVTVHFKANEHRAPYLDFHYLRYSGKCLNDPNIVNTNVEIHVNKDDLRRLEVYKDGKFLGVAFAPKSWQRFPHSYRTRSYIFKLIRSHKMSERGDPLVNYFNFILLNKTLPKNALEIVRVYREFMSGTGTQYVPGTATTEDIKNENLEDLESDEFEKWNPSMSGF